MFLISIYIYNSFNNIYYYYYYYFFFLLSMFASYWTNNNIVLFLYFLIFFFQLLTWNWKLIIIYYYYNFFLYKNVFSSFILMQIIDTLHKSPSFSNWICCNNFHFSFFPCSAHNKTLFSFWILNCIELSCHKRWNDYLFLDLICRVPCTVRSGVRIYTDNRNSFVRIHKLKMSSYKTSSLTPITTTMSEETTVFSIHYSFICS